MNKATPQIQVNKVTGLTPTQEGACSLLAAGVKTSAVSEQLEVPE